MDGSREADNPHSVGDKAKLNKGHFEVGGGVRGHNLGEYGNEITNHSYKLNTNNRRFLILLNIVLFWTKGCNSNEFFQKFHDFDPGNVYHR